MFISPIAQTTTPTTRSPASAVAAVPDEPRPPRQRIPAARRSPQRNTAAGGTGQPQQLPSRPRSVGNTHRAGRDPAGGPSSAARSAASSTWCAGSGTTSLSAPPSGSNTWTAPCACSRSGTCRSVENVESE